MSWSLRQLWVLTALSLAMMAAGLIWAGFEARALQDTLVWIKPFKFALSLAVFFATLAWAVQGLGRPDGWLLRGTVAVLAAAFLFEMIYITLQAAQGQASHFNTGDLYHEVMYVLMGLGAVSLVLGTAVIGGLVLRDGVGFAPNLRFGIGVGFILSTVLTLITAATMSSMAGHFIGTPGGAVIPFFGWSATVGDLRPSHFVALHAMQAVPVAAVLVKSRARIIGFAAAYTVGTLGLYLQALMGLPMIHL